MSKRFIDTGFLDQKWIRKLPPDKKIFLIYLMLKCDNGGIIELDFEDVEFWIGKKIADLKFLPEDYLIPLSETVYFMPKFIEYQYPNFPHSKVHQQMDAKRILQKHGIYNPETQTINIPNNNINVGQSLGNTYLTGNVNGNGNGNGNVKGGVGETENPENIAFNFYSTEVKKAKEFSDAMSLNYIKLCNHICQKNKDGSWRLPYVLRMKNQLSLDEFAKLYDKSGKNLETIIGKIDSLQTNVKYHGKYTDLYLTINKWLNNK